MKAIQINIRAMISRMIRPKRFPVAPRALESPETIVGPHVTLPLNLYSSPPIFKVVTLFFIFPATSVDDVILFAPFPMIISVHSCVSPCHVQVLFGLLLHELIGECMTDMMMSPNDSANETTAGTKARPINSVILNDPSLSASQNPLSPRTYLIVKSGENIA